MTNNNDATMIDKEQTGHIAIRSMTSQDVEYIVDEFERTWSEEETSGAAISRLDARHFVMRYLLGTTRARIAELDGRFMGVTLLSVDGLPLVWDEAQVKLREVDAQLEATSVGRENLAKIRFWHRIEDDVEVESHVLNYAQAELKLFLVSADARGHGVGSLLWKDMLIYLRDKGVQSFFLHTDSSCDVSYYDHIGMNQVAARMGTDNPDEAPMRGTFYDDIFIYAADVDKQLVYWGLKENVIQNQLGESSGDRS
jgi:GNAT superfamily N-acetyltransferase